MIRLTGKRCGPIGVDVGSQTIKLLQLSGDRTRIEEAVRWELPEEARDEDPQKRAEALGDALRQAISCRDFRGRDAVLSLGSRELFVQNIRVPKSPDGDLSAVVAQEAAARVPYSIAETDVRYLEAADIRHGGSMRREVILLACHRPVLERLLESVTTAGLRPVAVDVEPLALMRCYALQFRRDEDRSQRVMFVHVGASKTAVVIAAGTEILFIKYLEVGGQQMDEAAARYLGMSLADAAMLRRHNGDRRAEQQDAEVARGVSQAIRPVVDRLANELSNCIRYHSVTFRGAPLSRTLLGGIEASEYLVRQLVERHDIECELAQPLRSFKSDIEVGRDVQWDVAAGLALREVN
ncbi:MAG: type IV pilus assembly protein PilM [Planctomycetota bacterium]|nr:MAG: type IV pilus assembly protein PilM [Planctomycetota bacterium]REJ94556.1 MAG: type IV pilus assembly protein PilM [Planctomycetota bacterium]REK18581.1 MAG: type IV pilus assembly protein PilM [Planctomycetota bacterium]REK37476.1 MAG: type IV pilus assembly protein PilM [Planctomycetota bacterium]